MPTMVTDIMSVQMLQTTMANAINPNGGKIPVTITFQINPANGESGKKLENVSLPLANATLDTPTSRMMAT